MSDPASARAPLAVERLPTQPTGTAAPEWWGVLLLVVIEGVVFTSLVVSYFYFRVQRLAWPPAGIEPPELPLSALNTALLVASAVPVYLTTRAARRGALGVARIAMPVGMLMLAAFIVIKVFEYTGKPWDGTTHAYGSVVFTITGLHLAHVSAVLLKSAVIYAYVRAGRVDARRTAPLEANALYWYFVIAIWMPLFTVIYLVPRIF